MRTWKHIRIGHMDDVPYFCYLPSFISRSLPLKSKMMKGGYICLVHALYDHSLIMLSAVHRSFFNLKLEKLDRLLYLVS